MSSIQSVVINNDSDSIVPSVQIRSYRPEDHQEVANLFVQGMMHYRAHQEQREKHTWYINHSLNSDLADIEGTYLSSGGNFWIATIQEDGQENPVVVGMVGLQAQPDGVGELRRMSVKDGYRRYGIGRLLLRNLEEWAKANGFVRVSLSTAVVMTTACQFYEVFGYEKTKTEPVPNDPTYTCVLHQDAEIRNFETIDFLIF